MRLLREFNVGVRQQALLVLALSGFVYLLYLIGLVTGTFGKRISNNLFSEVLGLVWVVLLLIVPVLAIVLLISYIRAGRPYRGWVYCALAAAFSPWFLCLLLWFLFHSRFEPRFERYNNRSNNSPEPTPNGAASPLLRAPSLGSARLIF
jgi:hypothetical protein